jgi:formylglycine-generating enzyme required for sulfatase activity
MESFTPTPDNPPGTEWIRIPAGNCINGESKQRKTIQNSHQIGKYPVTFAQYQHFIDANPDFPLPFVKVWWAKPYNWNQ